MQLLPHVSEETRNRRKSFCSRRENTFRMPNCGLPYYIGGVIAEREKLFVQTPEAFGKRFNIDVRTRSEVIAIHSAEKTVDIRTSDGKLIRRVMTNYCFLRVRRLSVLPCRVLTMKESSRFAM